MTEPAAPEAPEPGTRRTDTVTVVGGAVVWGLVSVLLAMLEVALLPLATDGGTHLPFAVPLAVVANVVLPGIVVRGVGLRLGWIVPAVAWAGVVLVSASRTADGDLLISGSDWAGTVNAVFLIAGALSLGLGCAVSGVPFSSWRRKAGPAQPVRGSGVAAAADTPAAPSAPPRR